MGLDLVDLKPTTFSFIEIIGLHHMRAFIVSEAPRDYGFLGVLWCVVIGGVCPESLKGEIMES